MNKRILGLVALPVLVGGSAGCQREPVKAEVAAAPVYPQQFSKAFFTAAVYRQKMDGNNIAGAQDLQANQISVGYQSGPFDIHTVPEDKLMVLMKLLAKEEAARPTQFNDLFNVVSPQLKTLQIDNAQNKEPDGVQAVLVAGNDTLLMRVNLDAVTAQGTPILETFARKAAELGRKRSLGYCFHARMTPRSSIDPGCNAPQFTQGMVLSNRVRETLKL